eukprot:TRINITY_DN20674_c0_g1_i2.p1 TRINITY_DN20674_c0_g1~~TRINITY_DN20674_c0_g1_i2.p1  ORF type:complete len:489 (-),score=52.64 TRINITY_DN20674_c0_g1_i2:252-1718(-)
MVSSLDDSRSLMHADGDDEKNDDDEEDLADRLTIVGSIELIILTFVMFYADIITDIVAMRRFFLEGYYWFFGINAFAVFLSMSGAALLGWQIAGLDREEDPVLKFGSFVSLKLGDHQVLVTILCFFQLHILGITIEALCNRRKPMLFLDRNFNAHLKFLGLCKAFEAIEGSLSLFVQGYDLVWDPDLSSTAELTLQVSVAMSIASLAFNLCTMDKHGLLDDQCVAPPDVELGFARPLENNHGALNGAIKSMASIDFALVFLFRVAETTLAFGSCFLFQLLTRPYGGFIFVGVSYLCIVAKLGNVLAPVLRKSGLGEEEAPLVARSWIGIAILGVPQIFYFTGPVTFNCYDIYVTLALAFQAEQYICLRCANVVILMVIGCLKAGGPTAVWDTWNSYNATAPKLACAVGICFVAYPLLFYIIRRRTRRPANPRVNVLEARVGDLEATVDQKCMELNETKEQVESLQTALVTLRERLEVLEKGAQPVSKE